VLERNGFTCQSCGAVAGEPHPYDSSQRTRLQIGHIIDKSKGGTDAPSNLRAVCSVCNGGLQNITPIRPDLLHLLVQVRRARTEDQRAVLDWLQKKFGKSG
jgi:5-methylcytosine-specific restriction endonuclease McrA